jgi:DNA-binding MarR family transcriptional regulator
MGTFLTEVKGFTPLIDALTTEVGLVQAAVYGAVWRHCQMRDGICTASQDTLAELLGIHRATILRHLKELCKKGYLRDTTPDLRNRPHTYADTGKAKIYALVEARVSDTSGNGTKRGVAESNSGVAESDSTVAESDTQVLQKVTRRENETIEDRKETPVSDSGEEKTEAEREIEKFLGPKQGRQPTGVTGNWASPVSAGGSDSPAARLVDDMCRFNGLTSGIDALPENQRVSWMRHVSEMLAQWDGATVEEVKQAWLAWRENYSWHGRCNPFYKTFPTEFGPLLAEIHERGVDGPLIIRCYDERDDGPRVIKWDR